MKKLTSLVLCFFLFYGCSDDTGIEINQKDHLIFGHFYGECGGEGCIETFKLTDEKLFEDLNDNYGFSGEFDFTELDAVKFEEVKDLINFFPTKLLSADETNFGCPDCGDWGGFLVEYKKGDEIKRWTIDTQKQSIPSYLHDFIDKIDEKIALINQ